MSSSDRHQLFLIHIREAQHRYPELLDLLSFYEQLSRTGNAFMRGPDIPPAPVHRNLDRTRLSRGVPQFTFEELLIGREDFFRLSSLMHGVIIHHMPQYRNGGNGVADEVLLQRARTIFESRNPVVTSDAPLDPTGLIAGLSLVPYMQRACDVVLDLIPPDAWQRPYCPVCGGKPCFAALEKASGARRLLCSRCGAEWIFGRIGCAFCESTDKHIYYQSSDGLYRLYACDVCKRYLKTIDLRQIDRKVYLPVECIVTVPMDIAAQHKGYRHY